MALGRVIASKRRGEQLEAGVDLKADNGTQQSIAVEQRGLVTPSRLVSTEGRGRPRAGDYSTPRCHVVAARLPARRLLRPDRSSSRRSQTASVNKLALATHVENEPPPIPSDSQPLRPQACLRLGGGVLLWF